jgi:Ca2+-binding RTX toxin-like protein
LRCARSWWRTSSDDSLDGGTGNDTITGDPSGSNPGHDRLIGGNGADTLQAVDGVSGNDVLNGNGGTDTCTADAGDTIGKCP